MNKQTATRNIASAPLKRTAPQPIKTTLAASNKLLAKTAPKTAKVRADVWRKSSGYTALPRTAGVVPSNHNVPVGSAFETRHDLKPREIANLERELASTNAPAKASNLKSKKKSFASKTAVKN
jgi:hypothetical protein